MRQIDIKVGHTLANIAEANDDDRFCGEYEFLIETAAASFVESRRSNSKDDLVKFLNVVLSRAQHFEAQAFSRFMGLYELGAQRTGFFLEIGVTGGYG